MKRMAIIKSRSTLTCTRWALRSGRSSRCSRSSSELRIKKEEKLAQDVENDGN